MNTEDGIATVLILLEFNYNTSDLKSEDLIMVVPVQVRPPVPQTRRN